MATILVVDDEMGIRALLSEILSEEGHVVEIAENARAAQHYRLRAVPDLVLLDIWMPDIDGVTLLKEWAALGQLTMPVIMMSGHATIDAAVEATKIGAISFLEKPIALQKLLDAVKQGLVQNNRADTLLQASWSTQEYAPLSTPTTRPVTGQAPSATQMSAISFDIPLRDARDAFERAYFEYHLAREKGSMTRIAEKAGLERTHLYRKLKQLGIELIRNKAG
jgi:DNA-binding NtrC family response regulator